MDSRILQLIESANPQDRKKAIQMLAKLGGPEAIRTLGMIYKQETDSEVKDLAVQAGKYIKKQQTGENAAAQVAVRAPVVSSYEDEEEDDEPEQEADEEYVPVVVPASKQSQAKGLMDRALDLSMHGDKDKAIESISKAFKLNPNLRDDTYYMGVAMDITGMDKQSTIRLVTEDEKSRKVKNKEKLKNDGSGSEEVGWDTALVDLAMYFIVVSAVMIVGMVVLVQVFTAALTTMQACGCNSVGITSALSGLNSLRGIGVVVIILYGLVVGLLSAVFLLFQYGIIHLVSTMMLGGDGTYAGLVHRATTPLTIGTAFTGAVVLFSLYLSLQQVSDPAVVRAMLASGQQPDNSIQNLLGIVNMVAGFFLLGWLFNRIGFNYGFGSGRGCVAFVLSNIALFLLSFACTFALMSALPPSTFTNLMATPRPF
jgi:hypothetical protein